MKIRWSQILSVVLPIMGIAIEIADSIIQSNIQEQEKVEFEKALADKYGLVEKEH